MFQVTYIKEQLLKKYTLKVLSGCSETRNKIFIILTVISKTRFIKTLHGLEEFFYTLFADNDCVSSEAMNFAEAYMHVSF